MAEEGGRGSPYQLWHARLTNAAYTSWESIEKDWKLEPEILKDRCLADAVAIVLEDRQSVVFQEYRPYLLATPRIETIREASAWHQASDSMTPPSYLDPPPRSYHPYGVTLHTLELNYMITRERIGNLRVLSQAHENARRPVWEKLSVDVLTLGEPENLLVALEQRLPFLEEVSRGILPPLARSEFRFAWESSPLNKLPTELPRFTKIPNYEV